MGIIADNNWGNSALCEVAAKKSDGFTYRLNQFTIKAEISSEEYNPDDKTSSSWTEGKKNQIKMWIQ